MASVINTNMASLYAQKNLSGAQNALSTSVERLSSGLRINRAKDDAAGLGISEKIKSQVTSLNQGLRNANDAISMVQTAEGSLSEVSSILQRMKELSVQARNDSLSTTQRSFISDELVALKNEINAISERTTFNDLSLLKNALRTQVSVPALNDSTKLVNGATMLDGISVSNLAVKNTNAGTYTITTGTQTAITGQVSEAAGKAGASSEVDTINLLAGTAGVVAGSTLTATIAVTGGSTISATYTILADDLKANGDNTGIDATWTNANGIGRSNVAKKLAKAINDAAQSVSTGSAEIAAVANGTTIAISGSKPATTMTTTIAVGGTGTPNADNVSVTADSDANAVARTVTINVNDAVEGNKFTLRIGDKEYSAVAGYGVSQAQIASDVANQLRDALQKDYAGISTISATTNLGTRFSFAAGNSLGLADISLSVNRMNSGDKVTSQLSSVSPANLTLTNVTRTVTINDFDVVEGRKATIKVGNPDFYTEVSTVVGADDNAGTVATRLSSMLSGTYTMGALGGNATKETFSVEFFGTEVDGDTTIAFDGVSVASLGAGDGSVVATEFVAGYNAAAGRNYDATRSGNVVTFTQRTAASVVDVKASDFTITDVGADNTVPVSVVVNAPSVKGSVGNQITFADSNNLGMSVIDISFNEMVDGAKVDAKSTVSAKNLSRADRTITINQNDLTPGNVVSVDIGGKEYAVKVEAGDLAANVAYRLSTLIGSDYGGKVTSPSISTSGVTGAGTYERSTVTFDAAGMAQGDSITIEGLTFTASRDLSQSEVAVAFTDLSSAAGNLASGNVSALSYGVYSGRLGGAGTGATDPLWATTTTSAGSVLFTSSQNNIDVSNLAVSARRAVSVGASGTANVITLGAGLELGLENISVSVKKITDPGKITITANANTGIGGTSQSLDVGTIAAGGSKTFDFDNLGVSFTLNNSRATAVNSASFEAFTPKVNTLAVESAMDGEALFQVGAGTRDNVVLDGFKDIRMTGQNQNVGAEKEVFDKVYETLTLISANTTESLSEANFATLENRIEDAITMVSDFRSYFGGQQNRIEFAISNIQAQSENLTAANSRIVDTDYAAETANLTKTQIMQQAATAMLAQANQMPNVILALLK